MHISQLKFRELCEIRDALEVLENYGISFSTLKSIVEQRLNELCEENIVIND